MALLLSEPILLAVIVSFDVETFMPVTPCNVWHRQGDDVSLAVAGKRREIARILKSGTRGRFEADFVRLALLTRSGRTIFVDRFGGVRSEGRDTHLGVTEFVRLKRIVPDRFSSPRTERFRRSNQVPYWNPASPFVSP